MIRTTLLGSLVGAGLLLAALPAAASELIYQPVNPSFGGNPFNGSYLLSIANAQNLYLPERTRLSPIQDFERRVQSALLGRIASEITNQILGEDAKDSGVFQIDSTRIEFQYVGDEVFISISDGAGGSTEIIIPAPTF